MNTIDASASLIDDADHAFDGDTIQRFIDTNLALGNSHDEEFNHVIAQAYQASPKQFAKMLAGYTQEEIAYLAQSVAKDYVRTGRAAPEVKLGKVDPITAQIVNTIQAEINHAPAGSEERIDGAPTQPATPDGVVVPSIGTNPKIQSFAYTSSSEFDVGKTAELSIKLTRDTASSYDETYYIAVYLKVGTGNYLQRTDQTVTFPANSLNITTMLRFQFVSTGVAYTQVMLYTRLGGTLLESKTSSTTNTIKGKWKIEITLPEDRDYKGRLNLFNASGALYFSTECLGRSTTNKESTEYHGNTPLGKYEGYLDGPASDPEKFGPYKYVRLKVVEIEGDRDGFLIHGGREGVVPSDKRWYPLAPKNGCVRISNADQKTLQDQITSFVNNYYHYKTGDVTIKQKG